jgi:hypothetical protein
LTWIQNKKTAKGRRHCCGFRKIASRITGLFREINKAAAAVKHENQGYKKKQSHEDVEDAISLATRIFNVFHFYAGYVCCKSAAKVKKQS